MKRPTVRIAEPGAGALEGRKAEIVAKFNELLSALVEAVDEDHLYRVIDTTQDLEQMLEEWCDVQDALDRGAASVAGD